MKRRIKTVHGRKPILEFNPIEIFIGYDVDEKQQPIINTQFDRNTILMYFGGLKYVHVGPRIFIFTSYTQIINYINYLSPMGNSWTSQPYAWDEDGNIYLMGVDVVLKNTKKLRDALAIDPNPYDYYYNSNHGSYIDNHFFKEKEDYFSFLHQKFID
jgi:hypothetical protein